MITKIKNKNISALNTFRMNVSCRLFIEYDSIADLIDIEFDELPKPVLHIGEGSNLLFSRNFDGTILHSAIRFIYTLPKDNTPTPENEVLVSVGAGVPFDTFCEWASGQGLWGPENLSHIPGETGSAAVQNIGAYGVEVSDIIDEIYCYDTEEEEFVHFNVSECDYGYRDSMFKHEGIKGRYIVTNVIFRLSTQPKPVLDYGYVRNAVENMVEDLTPKTIRNAIIGIRKEKLPEVSETGSAGSFFKNPVVTRDTFQHVKSLSDTEVPHYVTGDMIKIPAAWLIEQCGWKGKTCGNAGVYEKQPLVIINATGHARPQEIIELKDKIIASVQEKFGIRLFPEVEII